MSYASSRYRQSGLSTLSPRETEASAFVFVNRMLAQDSDSGMRMRALAKNHELWSMLVKDLGHSSNRLPPALKADIVSIGLLAMQDSIRFMGNLRPLYSLIELNQDMIDALRAAPGTE